MAPGTRSSKDAAKATPASNTAGTSNNTSSTTDDIKGSNKSDNKENTAQPLGPPPRPQATDGDYFQGHSQNNPAYQAEPNPFEAQFGSTSADTPGKLPSVAALTSPSSLLPNETPSWSLRSGPLSPAMLTGPTGTGDYFDGSFNRNGFPTPNESGLRTGLTPGGTGSMFPMTSPSGGTPMFSTTLNGMPTPNTLDFFKTNANSRANGNATTNGPTSQPVEASSQSEDLKAPATTQASYNHPDADAANGLFMLAQSNGVRSNNQFSVPTTIAGGAVQPTEAFDSVRTRSQKNNSLGSSTINAEDDDDDEDDSDESEEQVKPTTRSRGKRQSEPIRPTTRRKATSESARNSKRQKMDKMMDDDDEEMMLNGKDPKKMTDEEKRKNFLERNRVAALKCRQRKKQWLQNLQSKVDLYSQENDALTQTVNMLREYVGQLRNMLLQHKDCPVTLSHAMGQHQLMGILTQDGALMPFQSLPPGGVPQNQMALPMMDQRNGRMGP